MFTPPHHIEEEGVKRLMSVGEDVQTQPEQCPIPFLVLEQVHQIDRAMTELANQKTATLKGFLAAVGVDLNSCAVSIDLGHGTYTVTEKLKDAPDIERS